MECLFVLDVDVFMLFENDLSVFFGLFYSNVVFMFYEGEFVCLFGLGGVFEKFLCVV